MDKVDITIIGAGVVGLAVAYELSTSFPNKSILVLEQHDAFGRETSSRNSEVVHGGMYYPTNTLKARLCVEGRRILYELCERNHIGYKKIGKLIIAAEEGELPDLEKIAALGKANGVEGLEMIDGHSLREMEPNLLGITALYSTQTGIIDSHQLMKFYLDSAKKNGVMVVYNAQAKAIQKDIHGYKITVFNNGEEAQIISQVVVNCAGLDSDSVAASAGIDIEKCGYRLHYCKGQYFRVNSAKSKFLSRLAYPVPKPKSGGLGVHATLDLSGGLRLGPDDNYQSDRVKDYTVDKKKCDDFYSSAVKFMPFIAKEDLYPDTAGIRPKLQPQGGVFRDFVIQDEADKGLPGFINLIGIESPGLTASLAIARYVKGVLR